MLFGILNRMIFWELVRVFLLALTGLTGLFLVGGIIQQATQYGVSGQQLLRIVPLLIPNSLPYTIPATMLFATCVVYGRLAHDNEAVALKAAGVDLLTMIRPAFLLGLITASITAGLEYSLIPMAQKKLFEEPIRDPEETLYNLLKRERAFKAPNMPYVLYVRDVQDRRLLDVVVKRKTDRTVASSEDGFDYVARTREAVLKIDTVANTLTVDSNDWIVTGNKALIESQDNKPFEIALPSHLRRDKFDADMRDRSQTLDWHDLPGRAAEFVVQSENNFRISRVMMEAKPGRALTPEEQFQIAIEYDLDPANVPRDPDERAKQADHYNEVGKFLGRNGRTMEWEYHTRPALAVGCLLFGLIGCPMGLWANRSDYLSIFVICFLPAVIIYYPIVMAGGGVGRDGRVPMFMGVWAANAVAGIAGIVLMWRLIRR